jgi:DNA-binding FrmR family transcriptional regulator
MEIPETSVADLTRRLPRVEGQLRGIQQMVADERDCGDIVTQMSAGCKALDRQRADLVHRSPRSIRSRGIRRRRRPEGVHETRLTLTQRPARDSITHAHRASCFNPTHS